MQCQGTKQDRTQCSRIAKPNGYCWQHQGQSNNNDSNITEIKKEQQDIQNIETEFELITDLQNIVDEYITLKDYPDLIEAFPGVYTWKKYTQIQNNLERELADEIKDEYTNLLDKYLNDFYIEIAKIREEINNPDDTSRDLITRVGLIRMFNSSVNGQIWNLAEKINKFHNNIITKILEALDIANILVDGNYIVEGSGKSIIPIFAKYELGGILRRDFSDTTTKDLLVRIRSNTSTLSVIFEGNSEIFLFPSENLTPLWRLYVYIETRISELSVDINNITLN